MSKAGKQNVLWIMADQMRGDVGGFAGDDIVRTPNLDALAARGTVFDRAYAQCPLCTPSRLSMFTGRYLHGHGAWWNGMPGTDAHTLLPGYLREWGYDTAAIGKLHLLPTSDDHGFDYKELHEERLEDEFSAYGSFLSDAGYSGRFPRSFTDWDFPMVGVCNMPEEIEETRWVADRTDEYLRTCKDRDKPFFLSTSFIRPHSPYNPLPRFAEMYDDAEIPSPPFAEEDRPSLPPRIRELEAVKGWDQFTAAQWILLRRRYYGLCSQVDDAVGNVLSSLERYGLSDDTIVIFTSDHGDFVGDHGMVGKGHPWESALKVPLIVYDPASPDSGLHMPDLVELVDIMPSLLDMLGIDIPASVQGMSFVPSVDSARVGTRVGEHTRKSHRDYAFSESVTHSIDDKVLRVMNACENPYLISVRSDNHHYIRYAGEPGELYCMNTDPDERDNLFGRKQYRDLISTLESEILEWLMSSACFQQPDPGNSYFSTYFAHGGSDEYRY